MKKRSGYRGYYFENTGPSRVLVATYNERRARERPDHPVWGWFKPHGDKGFQPGPGDILREEPVLASISGGKSYYRVTLSESFMSRNGIGAIPPDPKFPTSNGGWAPYGTSAGFADQLASFPGDSSVGRVLARLGQLRDRDESVRRAFELMAQARSEESLDRVDVHLRDSRAILQELVVSDRCGIRADLDAMSPPVHATPHRAPDEAGLTDAEVWHLRLLHGLIAGVDGGRIAA